MKINQINGLFLVQYQGIKTLNKDLILAIETTVKMAKKRAAFRATINALEV